MAANDRHDVRCVVGRVRQTGHALHRGFNLVAVCSTESHFRQQNRYPLPVAILLVIYPPALLTSAINWPATL